MEVNKVRVSQCVYLFVCVYACTVFLNDFYKRLYFSSLYSEPGKLHTHHLHIAEVCELLYKTVIQRIYLTQQ